MQLFALQNLEPSETQFPVWLPVIIIAAIVSLFIGVLTWLVIRQIAKSRDLRHLERMKALELGRAIGPSEAEKTQAKYLHNIFWISFWIGAGVPMAASSAAGSVMIQTQLQDFGIIRTMWICVAVISVASVICATVLMKSSRRWSTRGIKESDHL
jgi:mannitol-specific phosphotransferase system IIBC component